jgi:proteasome lid subunit RPN8/RPN11
VRRGYCRVPRATSNHSRPPLLAGSPSSCPLRQGTRAFVKSERATKTRRLPFVMSRTELNRLHRRAYRAQQNEHREVCGVVLSDTNRRLRLLFVRNRVKASYRHEMFRSDVSIIARRLGRRERILGTFHSHPLGEARPSAGDLMSGFFNGRELIYDVCARKLRLWRLVKRRKRLFELPIKIGG